MRKRLLSVVITVVMIVSMMPAASFGAKPEGKLVILATSDVHCAIERSVDKETGAAKSIGYAGFAGYKNTVEKTFGRKNVVALDCGDALQGSLVGSYSKGMSIVRAMNAVGYDVCVPGNHDFDYTAANYFNNIVPALNADVVSCNIKKTASDTTVLEPYVIKKYKKLNNIQIAYVGITTPSSPVTSNPNISKMKRET